MLPQYEHKSIIFGNPFATAAVEYERSRKYEMKMAESRASIMRIIDAELKNEWHTTREDAKVAFGYHADDLLEYWHDEPKILASAVRLWGAKQARGRNGGMPPSRSEVYDFWQLEWCSGTDAAIARWFG